MSKDQHYYVSGYSVEDDPYSQPNGVLINNYEITNTAELNIIEARSSSLALQQLLQIPPPKDYSVDTLKIYHKELFGDVYPWAGEFRKVDIAKGDTFFESHNNIPSKLKILFEACKSKNYFVDLPIADFSQESAELLIELNRIHPFREGNGRVQRLLLSHMALNAGFRVSWESVSDSAIKNACIAGIEGNSSPMQKLLNLNLSLAPIDDAKSIVTKNILDIRTKSLKDSASSDITPPTPK